MADPRIIQSRTSHWLSEVGRPQVRTLVHQSSRAVSNVGAATYRGTLRRRPIQPLAPVEVQPAEPAAETNTPAAESMHQQHHWYDWFRNLLRI